MQDGLTLSIGTIKDTLRKGVAWRGSVYWTWGASDERTSSIGYEFYPHGVTGQLWLFYTTTRASGEKIESDYWVELETTPCNLGGVRWWFRCPLVKNGKLCGRRCGKLHCPPGALYYGCRHCYELTYTSSQEAHQYEAMFAMLARDTGFTPAQVKTALSRRAAD